MDNYIINKILRRLTHIFADPNIRVSFISIICIIIVSTVLVSLSIRGTSHQYSIGDRVLEDIRAPKDIHYLNEVETNIEKKRISESVQAVFDRDASVLTEKLKITGDLFSYIATTLEENPPLGTEDVTFQLISLKSRLPRNLAYDDKILYEFLSYKNTEYLKKEILKILIYIYDNNQIGIADKPYDNPLGINNKNITIRLVNSPTAAEEISRSVTDLITVDEINSRLNKICYSISPGFNQKKLTAIISYVQLNIKPNIWFNIEETRRRINENVNNVKPVMGVLKKGQIVARVGDTVTMDILKNIRIINKEADSANIKFILGIFLMQIVFLMIIGYFMLEYNRILIPDRQSSFVIFSLMIFFMVYTFSLAQSPLANTKLLFPLMLPLPFVTMIVSILYNSSLALIVGMYVVFFTALIGGTDLSFIISSFSSALLGVFVNANVRKRTDFLSGGFILGLVNSIVIVAIGLVEENSVRDTFRNIQLAFANGMINSILVMGVFPLYESIFGITTRFKLMELSDLNADIFKKMLVKAPGTYNHSLIVSTMAETACKDIYADYMLARVGAYYHDIGKIDDAGIYIENKVTDPRAKTMSPSEYSMLIISHIKKGIELAKKNNIPDSVIDFIREHHGKSTMTYFYHQALEDAPNEDNQTVEKSNFQYPGPKPHRKETAVVMLADAVEAASRSLSDPTYVKLEGLVRRIIYNKLNDGELEYSDLSMSDLNRIQRSFLRILNGIFHTRIEYPDRDEVEKLETKVMKNGSNGNGARESNGEK